MKITTGFIGAGKAGCAFGRYLADCGVPLSGYYDVDENQARDAGIFTGAAVFASYEEAIKESDAIFLAVPDGNISDVWEAIRHLPLEGKEIFHMSGAVDSSVFAGIEKTGEIGAAAHVPGGKITDRGECQTLTEEVAEIFAA